MSDTPNGQVRQVTARLKNQCQLCNAVSAAGLKMVEDKLVCANGCRYYVSLGGIEIARYQKEIFEIVGRSFALGKKFGDADK